MAHLCLLVLAAASLIQPTPNQDLINAVDAYRAAIVAGQREVLSDLIHDDFSITSGSGQTRDKTGELNDLVAADLKVHEFRLDEARYRVVGGTGVVSGVLRWRMTYRGRESSIERRTSMTWVRDGKVWRLLGQHV